RFADAVDGEDAGVGLGGRGDHLRVRAWRGRLSAPAPAALRAGRFLVAARLRRLRRVLRPDWIVRRDDGGGARALTGGERGVEPQREAGDGRDGHEISEVIRM